MNEPRTSRIPAPLYAAAGAGELALQQLRKLPTVVTELGGKAVADLGGKAVATGSELRQKATETLRTANLTAGGLREKAVPAELDLDRFREAAARNAAVVLAGAQAAQERAFAAYGALVARGERVVGAGVLEAADTVNADIEVTEGTAIPARAEVAAPAEPEVTATPADIAEVVAAKPAAVKRTRATRSAATPSAKLPKPAAKRASPAAE